MRLSRGCRGGAYDCVCSYCGVSVVLLAPQRILNKDHMVDPFGRLLSEPQRRPGNTLARMQQDTTEYWESMRRCTQSLRCCTHVCNTAIYNVTVQRVLPSLQSAFKPRIAYRPGHAHDQRIVREYASHERIFSHEV